MSEIKVRIAIEVLEGKSMRLVLLATDTDGQPESRLAVPVLPDDARGLADALFFAAKQVDPAGHDVMIERVSKALTNDLVMQNAPPIGGVH